MQADGPSGNHGAETPLSQAHTSTAHIADALFSCIPEIRPACQIFLGCFLVFFAAQDTQNPSCLKQFLDHHGLSLLWIFMVELSESKGNSANNTKLQLEVRFRINFVKDYKLANCYVQNITSNPKYYAKYQNSKLDNSTQENWNKCLIIKLWIYMKI